MHRVYFETRLICIRPKDSGAPTLSIPAYVKTLIDEVGISDGFCPFEPQGYSVWNENDAKNLFQLLVHPDRKMPAIVVSAASEAIRNGSPYPLDVRNLAEKTLGIAHVFSLSANAAPFFSRLIGRKQSVYNGGIRYYRAGFDINNLTFANHPLALKDTVLYWENGKGPAAYTDHLVRQAYKDSISALDVSAQRSFIHVKSRILQDQATKFSGTDASTEAKAQVTPESLPVALLPVEEKPSSGPGEDQRPESQPTLSAVEVEESLPALETIAEPVVLSSVVVDPEETINNLRQQLAIAHNQIEALRQEVDEALGLAAEQELRANNVSEDYGQAVSKIDELERVVQTLRRENDDLHKARKDGFGVAADAATIPIPESLDELQEWVDRHFSDRILLTDHALRACKKSEYEDVASIYSGLQLIASQYYDMVFSTNGAQASNRKIYEQALKESRFDISNTFASPPARAIADSYYVSVGKERKLLDRHLSHGNSRDSRHCLRIYFCAHPERPQIIIGHLPSHLPNSMSRR